MDNNMNLMISLLLADQKAKKLKKEGFKVPSNFKSKAILFGTVSPNPAVGLLLIQNEAKKIEKKGKSVLGSAPRIVSGAVMDIKGQAMANVTVKRQISDEQEEREELTTKTNEEGKFEISAKGDDFLIFPDVDGAEAVRLKVDALEGTTIILPVQTQGPETVETSSESKPSASSKRKKS